MSKLGDINKICDKIMPEGSFGDKIRNSATKFGANLAGNLVNNVAKASGIPIVTALGNTLGDITKSTIAGTGKDGSPSKRNVPADGEQPAGQVSPRDRILAQDINIGLYNKGYHMGLVDTDEESGELVYNLFNKNGKSVSVYKDRYATPVKFRIPMALFRDTTKKEKAIEYILKVV